MEEDSHSLTKRGSPKDYLTKNVQKQKKRELECKLGNEAKQVVKDISGRDKERLNVEGGRLR